MGRSNVQAALVSIVLAALLAGCGTSTARQGPIQRTGSPVVRIRGGPTHVAVVVMENEEYGEIIGSPSTPYLNALARRHALATSMYAIIHPSLPNYLALTGGSTFGVDSDCTDCSVRASGLADQLSRAHISWKAYMEDLPHPCFRGAQAGGYAKKHNPFMYYRTVAGNLGRCRRVVPLTELGADERGHTLPRFIWITPNLCHDMHDCAPAVGDRFLSVLLPPLLAALGRRGVLVLTWDEGSSDRGCCRLAAGGHIATMLVGSAVRWGARWTYPADQYSILQTIEDLLGLARLRGAACSCTPSLAPLLRGTRPAPTP